MTVFRYLSGPKPKTPALADDACVAKNSWWLAECPKHGNTTHLAVLGGRCTRCQDESLEDAQREGRSR